MVSKLYCEIMFVLVLIYLFCIVLTHGSEYLDVKMSLRTRRQANRCRFPQNPQFGKWIIDGTTFQRAPGELVPFRTFLEVNCSENFRLEGYATTFCTITGEWTPQIGQCLRKCPPISDTPWMNITCVYNNQKLSSCADTVQSTIAIFYCAPFYKPSRPYSVCDNGSWGGLAECTAVCGKERIKDPRNIIGGVKAKEDEYPWQVALYTKKDKELICGGSLLNERVVLTAAHCVANNDGSGLPKENYIVAVGKYYRNFYDPQDLNKTQLSYLSEIHIPRQYQGYSQNYLGDIAILVTEKTFVFSNRVQPVCIDWGSKQYNAFLRDQSSKKLENAQVAGWGFTTESADASDVLKALIVPVISEEVCKKVLHETDDNKYLTYDKLCAGVQNKSTSVCRGDSGGGLTYQFGRQYYIIGIVSIAPQAEAAEGGCDSQQYSLYTNVSHYTESFILGKQEQYKPSTFGDLQCNYDINCKMNASITPTTEKSPTPEIITEVITNPEIISITAVPPRETTMIVTIIPRIEAVIPKIETTTPIAEIKGCILPPQLEFGRWYISGLYSQKPSPGQLVLQGTVLRLSCEHGFRVRGKKTMTCQEGKWSNNPGYCYTVY